MRYCGRLLLTSLVFLPGLARAASFTPLGGLTETNLYSTGQAISGDGTAVVGESTNGIETEAYRWTGGTMTGLGFLSGYDGSTAFGASEDGAVVVGQLYGSSSNEAFRWSGGVMTGLGFLDPDSYSAALGVSADGGVVVGFSGAQAFRWASGTMSGLGFLPGGTYSAATGVSGDGDVVVGDGDNSAGNNAAFRWSNGVISSLTESPVDPFWSTATGISADGAFVVGGLAQTDGAATEAFRWSADEVLQLGFLHDWGTDSYSFAEAASADGSVIVGGSTDEEQFLRAFVWTESGGMVKLADLLAANGVAGLEDWILFTADAVSADGTRIVGTALNPDGEIEAFIADITPVPEPSASWLLGSALAALACARRRIAL